MLKGVRDVVETLLTENPHLRDDDQKLLANVYWVRISKTLYPKLNEEQMDGVKKVLKEIADANLPNFQSVSRCRRKLQEENPELRGKLYEERHKNQANVVEELRMW